ncbi:tyrosine-type DNA invertase [Citrobacter braakii]|uniref:tyrosine-type DNA invertase n=1 Tax=Citrobacter braakii TaxID=57706 RepID=UPI00351D7705
MVKRKYLTLGEIRRMIKSVNSGVTGARDSCLILLTFRHGFRISEILNLRFHDLNIEERRVCINRLKNGFSTVHPIHKDELIFLKKWFSVRRKWKSATESDRIFISIRGTPLSRSQAWRIIRLSGELSGIAVGTHPHMLRHACGYELAERGTDTRLIQDYLGHKNIRHTVLYTASNAERFTRLWGRKK